MQNSQCQGISEQTKRLIINLLDGKFSLTEIANITGISEQYLQSYISFSVKGYFVDNVLLQLKKD